MQRHSVQLKMGHSKLPSLTSLDPVGNRRGTLVGDSLEKLPLVVAESAARVVGCAASDLLLMRLAVLTFFVNDSQFFKKMELDSRLSL